VVTASIAALALARLPSLARSASGLDQFVERGPVCFHRALERRDQRRQAAASRSGLGLRIFSAAARYLSAISTSTASRCDRASARYRYGSAH